MINTEENPRLADELDAIQFVARERGLGWAAPCLQQTGSHFYDLTPPARALVRIPEIFHSDHCLYD